MTVKNILMAGVGGQGVIVASQAMAAVARLAGLDVKKSDVHGMAQRGGSVLSHVRFGEKVYSPLIPDGEADILMSTEKLEAIRWLPFVKKGGKIAVNTQMIMPPTVTRGAQEYPKGIIEKLTEFDPDIVAFDCLEVAKEVGNPRTATVVLLGALSTMLDFDPDLWTEALKTAVPQKVMDVNMKAFAAGVARGKK